MGIEKESFVGNPFKTDLVVENDDDDGEYISGDEIEFAPFVLSPGAPDFLLQDILANISDDDDEDYDPTDDYDDFLSDSDFIADGSGESGLEEVDGYEEMEQLSEESAISISSESATIPGDNKSSENKISDETSNSSISNSTATGYDST